MADFIFRNISMFEVQPRNTSAGKEILQAGGEILGWIQTNPISSVYSSLDYDFCRQVLTAPIVQPCFRLSVLNEDESVRYIIPIDDIISQGLTYNEGYQNGDRKSLSLKLVNVYKNKLYYTHKSSDKNQYFYPYLPNIDNLWYGTKISFDAGFIYEGREFLLRKGIFIITSFDTTRSTSANEITYELKDKFSLFSGKTGVLSSGYEIAPDNSIVTCLNDLLNQSCTDGTPYDIATCILDSSYVDFVTKATIRVDEGGQMSEIIDQLATQMSAEYFYNNMGNLVFQPMDESMNDINKPVIWSYTDVDISALNLKGEEDIINVVKVIGNNVDNEIFTGEAKNTNLSSPINIYRIKERQDAPIENVDVYSDEMAQELAEYNLRSKNLYQFTQTIDVPYNPLLTVNNLIEITNEDLNLIKSLWLIKSVSYTTGSNSMNVEIAALDNLPIFIKGVAKRGN